MGAYLNPAPYIQNPYVGWKCNQSCAPVLPTPTGENTQRITPCISRIEFVAPYIYVPEFDFHLFSTYPQALLILR